MNYRVYLIDSHNRFRAAESFAADDNLEAEEVALGVFGSCSTSFHAMELWQGSKMITRRTNAQAWPIDDLRKLLDKRQESIAQLEELLERSFECVRQSRQLMDTLGQLRLPRQG